MLALTRLALVAILVDGVVRIDGIDGTSTEFTVHGGFISVSNNRVSILTESTGNK